MVSERNQRVIRISAILGTLMLCALFCAQGTTQLLASAILPATDENKTTEPRRVSAPIEHERTPRELAENMLTRNMFDSQVGSMPWLAPVAAPVVDTTAPPDVVSDPTGEPAFCQGSLRLVAAFVVPRLPELSFVAIDSSGKTMLYRTGSQIEGHEIVGIREHRVFLRPSGRQLCQIAMFKPPESAQPPPSAPVATAEPPPPGPTGGGSGNLSEEELSQGITQLSDTQYSLTRTLLDKVLADQAELMRAARVIPYEENGRVIGVKVYGIRRSSILGRLGVQNGDVLRTINGFDLSSPDSALQAYTKLRELDQFSIAMIRRGTPRTMEYSVK